MTQSKSPPGPHAPGLGTISVDEYRKLAAREMPERTITRNGVRVEGLQSLVEKMAKSNGWAVYHTYNSRRSTPGFPDLILLRGSVGMAVELKAEAKQATFEQMQWLWRFTHAGFLTAVWRPSRWLSGEIERMLL